jgi:hypothetical protein
MLEKFLSLYIIFKFIRKLHFSDWLSSNNWSTETTVSVLIIDFVSHLSSHATGNQMVEDGSNAVNDSMKRKS